MSRVAPWTVWWADLDPTEGREQSGRRPVLVVSSPFHLRLTTSALITILPLTTRERPGWLHHVRIETPNGRTSFAMTEQIRTITRDRLSDDSPLTRLEAHEIAEVRAALGRMIDL